MNPTRAVVRTALNTTALLSPRLAGLGAFAVFRRPLGGGKPRPGERESAESAQQGRLTVGGKSVATYQWGEGDRPVLLVHGWASRATRFSAFVPALVERGHKVIAFDAPAHGASGGDTTTILEFRDIMRELQDQHGAFTAVVAHSFGALCSFFAVREGVKTESIVAIAGVSRFDHLVTGFRDQLGLASWVEQDLHRRVEEELFPGEPDIWRRFASPYAPEQVAASRVLLVHDKDDDSVGLHQASETADAYGSRARLIVTEGLGHRRILTDPDVVRQVTDFVSDSHDTRPRT